jgi:antitoxin (DNA-binding transcriptional repressor) of toxin-antitoxin stability system
MAAPSPTGSGGRRTVNMLEAKTHPSRLVEAIETGAETEVVIARNGRPVARLTALPGPERPRRLGGGPRSVHGSGLDRCRQSVDRRTV